MTILSLFFVCLFFEEQAKGITVEIAYASFETDKRRYTIIDSPGHRDYLTNMIEEASQGYIAVLMLSARATEFEDGFNVTLI